MLDPEIPVEEFQKVFLKARKEMNYVKYNIIKRNVMLNPIESLKDFAGKPKHYFDMVFKKTTKYGDFSPKRTRREYVSTENSGGVKDK